MKIIIIMERHFDWLTDFEFEIGHVNFDYGHDFAIHSKDRANIPTVNLENVITILNKANNNTS